MSLKVFRLIEILLSMIKNLLSYFKNSPGSSKDLVLWCCILITVTPAYYSLYFFSLYNVLVLWLKVILVFIAVFLCFECYDHPTRTWNFHHWWKQPLSVKVFRCLVAVSMCLFTMAPRRLTPCAERKRISTPYGQFSI